MNDCGIYRIRNIINNKIYIGSSAKLHKRKISHFCKLRKKKHHSQALQNAINKYGIENFIFEVIEYCDKSEKIIKEQYYIDTLKPDYNVSLSACCPMEGRKHSRETLMKFKDRPVRKGAESHMFGKKLSEETKRRMLEARKNYRHSQETKLKMSETSKRLNRFKDIEQYILDKRKKIIDSNGVIFNSLMETSRYHSISVQTVCDILKGRHYKTRKGVSFKYYE